MDFCGRSLQLLERLLREAVQLGEPGVTRPQAASSWSLGDRLRGWEEGVHALNKQWASFSMTLSILGGDGDVINFKSFLGTNTFVR